VLSTSYKWYDMKHMLVKPTVLLHVVLKIYSNSHLQLKLVHSAIFYNTL
jgi:hypothetical protein